MALDNLLSALALLTGAWILPFITLKMLMPALSNSPKAQTTNYAGRTIAYGLGVVWLAWAISMIFFDTLFVQSTTSQSVSLTVLGWMTVTAFGLGLFDDAYGTGESRGFKGHIKALLKGQLTTGGLKLFGLSLAAFVGALAMTGSARWALGANSSLELIGVALIAGATIALTSNFLNLTDLRPGRASKVYVVLIAIGLVFDGLRLLIAVMAERADTASLAPLFFMGLVLLGPVAASWKYDVSETSMLGDSGANPMGIVAGVYLISTFTLWGVIATFVIMLGLNLLSEKYSFTRLIARNSFLTKLDNIGRLKSGEQ